MHCSSKLIAPDPSHCSRTGLPDAQRPLLPNRRSRSRSRSRSTSRSPRNLCTNQNGRKRSRSRYSRATARTRLHVALPPSPSSTTQYDALPASGEAVGRTRRSAQTLPQSQRSMLKRSTTRRSTGAPTRNSQPPSSPCIYSQAHRDRARSSANAGRGRSRLQSILAGDRMARAVASRPKGTAHTARRTRARRAGTSLCGLL